MPAGNGTQVIYITGYADYCTRVYETQHIYSKLRHDFRNQAQVVALLAEEGECARAQQQVRELLEGQEAKGGA